MHDIVYILRNGISDSSEELRYSIRSVIKNFPYQNIWFAGGTPKGISADRYMPWMQTGQNKWFKIRNTLEKVCHIPELSDDFWLFNDDFFIMHPITDDDQVPVTNNTLNDLIARRTKNDGQPLSYITEVILARQKLRGMGLSSNNYEIHVPILMNKQKVLQAISKFPDCTQIRSIYGNLHNIQGIDAKDLKIQDLETIPSEDTIFISTSEKSFNSGKVGEYIKEKFPNKSKYET